MRSHCLILAGGKSERTGDIPKGLFPYMGKLWLAHQLQNVKKYFSTEITVVLGFHAESYFKQIAELSKYKTVANRNPENGQFSSLLTGLATIKNLQPIFVLPLDVPCPENRVWTLIEKSLQDNSVVVPCFKKKKGHPVLLSSRFAKILREIPPDSSDARLDRQISLVEQDKILHLDVNDPKICLNLNTLRDFETLLTSANGS